MNSKEETANKKGTKERILDVAIDLFSQDGYNMVSIRDIARDVEIHESTIYSHYKGKDDILNSIIERFLKYFQEEPIEIKLQNIIDETSPEDVLFKFISPVIQQLKIPEIRKILRLMYIELYHNQQFQDFIKNGYIKPTIKVFTNLFQVMMDKGIFKEYNAKILAREFFNYCIYLLFELFILDYDEKSYDELIENLMNKLSDHIKFTFDMMKNK